MKYSLLILALLYTVCSTPKAAPPATDAAPSKVLCNDHPLPEFTLGSDNPSYQAAVCECVWSNLDEQDRRVATDLRNGMSHTATTLKSFPIRFGEAIAACTSAPQ